MQSFSPSLAPFLPSFLPSISVTHSFVQLIFMSPTRNVAEGRIMARKEERRRRRKRTEETSELAHSSFLPHGKDIDPSQWSEEKRGSRKSGTLTSLLNQWHSRLSSRRDKGHLGGILWTLFYESFESVEFSATLSFLLGGYYQKGLRVARGLGFGKTITLSYLGPMHAEVPFFAARRTLAPSSSGPSTSAFLPSIVSPVIEESTT